jgi:hypothetical protein
MEKREMLQRIALLCLFGLAVVSVKVDILASEERPPAKGQYTVTSLTVEPPSVATGIGPVTDILSGQTPLATAPTAAIYPLETHFLKTSYYHRKFLGRPTANGEKYDPESFTCAHRDFPFNTLLKVTYDDKSVVVRVNDRGPFRYGKSLDLSYAAARELGILHTGVQKVRVEVLR